MVLGIAPDPQASSQAQTSQTQTGDASNSDKDVPAEKSKESSSASWHAWELVITGSENFASRELTRLVAFGSTKFPVLDYHAIIFTL